MMAAESGNETEMSEKYSDHDGGFYFIGSGWPYMISHQNRDGSVNAVKFYPMYARLTEASDAAKRAAISHARYAMKCTCGVTPQYALCACVDHV